MDGIGRRQLGRARARLLSRIALPANEENGRAIMNCKHCCLRLPKGVRSRRFQNPLEQGPAMAFAYSRLSMRFSGTRTKSGVSSSMPSAGASQRKGWAAASEMRLGSMSAGSRGKAGSRRRTSAPRSMTGRDERRQPSCHERKKQEGGPLEGASILRPGGIVIMDNLSTRKAKGAREAIEGTGAELRFPPSCSPDFNPIENVFSKLKALLRKTAARSIEELDKAVKEAMKAVNSSDCANYAATINLRLLRQSRRDAVWAAQGGRSPA